MKQRIGVKKVKRNKVNRRLMTKGLRAIVRNLNLGFKQLGNSEGVLVWVLYLFFNWCQDTIKHARIILGEMTM